MKLRPLNDRLLVRRVESEEASLGGIVIPDSAAKKPQQGEVLSTGPGEVLDNGEVRPLVVKSGDRVLFGEYTGDEIKLNGEDLVVMRERDVLAVLES
jgi:chaperonin GroES